MMIPVRCFTCGNPQVSEKYEEFNAKVAKGESAGKALSELGISRYCCRRMLLSQEPLIEEILPYARF